MSAGDGAYVLALLLVACIGVVVGYGAGYLIGHMRGYSCKVGDMQMKAQPRITAQDIIDRKNNGV